MTLQEAYVEALRSVRNPPMTGFNPHYRTRFATLGDVLESVREACEPLGIAYMQCVEPADGGYELRSYVVGGGECRKLSAIRLDVPQDPQKLGSAMTYMRRYLATCDWGIVGDPDDDGEAAGAKPKPATQQQAPKPQQQSRADHRKKLMGRLEEVLQEKVSEGFNPATLYEYVADAYGATDLGQLTDGQLTEVGKWLAAYEVA